MSKQPSMIRKQEARPVQNPQRIAMLFATFTGICAVALAGTFAYTTSLVETPTKVVTIEVPVAASVVDVVVARHGLAYNRKLERSDLRIVKWPKDSRPDGAFGSIDALFSSKGDRYLLMRVAGNEVVLPSKISEPGRRATLAALLRKDTRAVAVHVDAVLGVAGFVRPGDFVDVIMTRVTNETEQPEQYSVVLLQQVHVLGVDQTSRVTSGMSDVVKKAAKTVTLEVDLVGAQKLALANRVGRLSLALRQVQGTVFADVGRISLSDLGQGSFEGTQGQLQLASSASIVPAPAKHRTKTIGVTRATTRVEMEVVRDKSPAKP